MTEAEFWKRVDVKGPDECWPWLRCRTQGYGQFNENGKTVRAPRRAYELAKGPIDKGLMVCHTCDNRPCCNPAHLWLGTAKDNNHDAIKKGRSKLIHATRSTHPFSKLTHLECEFVRADRALGVSYRELARRYKVSHPVIYKLCGGRTGRRPKEKKRSEDYCG